MKTAEECCQEVAKKHGLGRTLVTGHKRSYYDEAMELYAAERIAASERLRAEDAASAINEANQLREQVDELKAENERMKKDCDEYREIANKAITLSDERGAELQHLRELIGRFGRLFHRPSSSVDPNDGTFSQEIHYGEFKQLMQDCEKALNPQTKP